MEVKKLVARVNKSLSTLGLVVFVYGEEGCDRVGVEGVGLWDLGCVESFTLLLWGEFGHFPVVVFE